MRAAYGQMVFGLVIETHVVGVDVGGRAVA
jgi:hypothetical protein